MSREKYSHELKPCFGHILSLFTWWRQRLILWTPWKTASFSRKKSGMISSQSWSLFGPRCGVAPVWSVVVATGETGRRGCRSQSEVSYGRWSRLSLLVSPPCLWLWRMKATVNRRWQAPRVRTYSESESKKKKKKVSLIFLRNRVELKDGERWTECKCIYNQTVYKEPQWPVVYNVDIHVKCSVTYTNTHVQIHENWTGVHEVGR